MKSNAGNPNIITWPHNISGESDAQAAIRLEKGRVKAWRQWLVILTLIFSDILLASLFWGLAILLQSIWGYWQLSAEIVVPYIVGNTVVWIGTRALMGLYPGYGLSPIEELRRQTYATLATLAIAGLLLLGLQVGDSISRLLVALNFLERLALAPLGRYFVKLGLAKLELWGKPVVILGAGETGKRLVRTLKKEWGLGYSPVGVFDFRLAPRGRLLEDVLHGESVADAIRLAKRQGLDTVIFAMPHIRRVYLARSVNIASRSFRHILVVPNLGGITTSIVVARDLAGTFAVEIRQNLLDPWARRIKRLLDLCGAVVGGLLISPLLLTIVVLIKLSSRGPVFYKQARLGINGRQFYCWKFRTMRDNASQLLTELLQSDSLLREEWKKERKLRNDPRVTRVGSFLRQTSLDELPQLWNVLRGEMSLVGPRPIVSAEISKYREMYDLYERVGPGMTGLWQVSGRSDTTYEERVALDAYYVRNWSIWLDLVILARTVKIVVLRIGAY